MKKKISSFSPSSYNIKVQLKSWSIDFVNTHWTAWWSVQFSARPSYWKTKQCSGNAFFISWHYRCVTIVMLLFTRCTKRRQLLQLWSRELCLSLIKALLDTPRFAVSRLRTSICMPSNQIDLHVTRVTLESSCLFLCPILTLCVSLSLSRLFDIENCRHSTFTKTSIRHSWLWCLWCCDVCA